MYPIAFAAEGLKKKINKKFNNLNGYNSFVHNLRIELFFPEKNLNI